MITESQLIEARDACNELSQAVIGFTNGLSLSLMMCERRGEWDKFWDATLRDVGKFRPIFERCRSVLTEEVRDFIRRGKHRGMARSNSVMKPIPILWPIHGETFVTTYHELAWMTGQAVDSIFVMHDQISVDLGLEAAEKFRDWFPPIAESIPATMEAEILIEHEHAAMLLSADSRKFIPIRKSELRKKLDYGETKFREWLKERLGSDIKQDRPRAREVEISEELLAEIEKQNPA